MRARLSPISDEPADMEVWRGSAPLSLPYDDRLAVSTERYSPAMSSATFCDSVDPPEIESEGGPSGTPAGVGLGNPPLMGDGQAA